MTQLGLPVPRLSNGAKIPITAKKRKPNLCRRVLTKSRTNLSHVRLCNRKSFVSQPDRTRVYNELNVFNFPVNQTMQLIPVFCCNKVFNLLFKFSKEETGELMKMRYNHGLHSNLRPFSTERPY